MGANSKAVVLGEHGIDEIASVVRNEHWIDSVEIVATKVDGYSILVAWRGESRIRLDVFAGNPVDEDAEGVHAGPRTIVHGATTGDGPLLMHALLENYGGFMRGNDGDENSRWTLVEPSRSAPPRTPSDDLMIDLAKVLAPEQAVAMRRIVDDAELLASVMAAFERYRDATAVDAPAP